MNESLVVLVRSLIGFFSLLIFTRTIGKQQVSQLTFFEYVLGITIGSIAASLTTDLDSRAWPHWMGLFVWGATVMIMQILSLKSRYFAKFIEGEPTVVIMNGKILEKSMRGMRYRLEDLLEQLRLKDVFDLSEIEFAVLEKNGSLSVLKKSQNQPVTPKDLNLPTEYKGISSVLIYDGAIMKQNLRRMNLEQSWLENELNKQGIKEVSAVFLASLETSGNLYVNTYADQIGNATEPGDLLGLD